VEPEFSGQICEKHSDFKFNENDSSGSLLFRADGRTNRRCKAVTIRNVTKALNNGSGAFNTTFVLTVMFLLAIVGQYHL
jgi:hypothetical protein